MVEPNIEIFEKCIEKQSKVLSENHYLQIMLKKRLFDIYCIIKSPPEENEIEFRNFRERQVNLG